MSSEHPHCEYYRYFEIYNRESGKTTRTAEGITDHEGNYRFEFQGEAPRGDYHVRVLTRFIEEGTHEHRCAGATSNWVTVKP